MLGGFLYVSPESVANDQERWRIKHEVWPLFYAPLNKFDRKVFDSPNHNVCIMTGIGPKKKN